MSVQITSAFVEEYSANVEFLAQQTSSRLASRVRVESQKGKSRFYEQIGPATAVKVTSRHQDTPRIDTNHQRRATYLNNYVASDLIDQMDEVELLISAQSAYANNFAMAFERAKDLEIITAATGTAYADTGSGNGVVSPVTLPATQQVAVNFVQGGGTGSNSGLTLAKLIQAKSLLARAEYPEGSRIVFAFRQQQLDNLLLNVSVVNDIHTSAVKALIAGEVNYFLGMDFVRTQLLSATVPGGGTGTDTVCTNFAYVETGILLAVGMDKKGRVSERDDKNYSVQVWYGMAIGATRMQEPYVVQVSCDESTTA
jgi:Phage capsid protein